MQFISSLNPKLRSFIFRLLRGAVAVAISFIIGEIVKEPLLPMGLAPLLLALDKLTRDWLNNR